MDLVQNKEARTLQNRLRACYLCIAPMCQMLQNEDDEEVGWDINYVDILIEKTREDIGKDFTSYSEFFEYINKETYEIISRFEFLFKMKIL